MGNRAVITTEEKSIGIYLHWNGGRDSVEGFLKFCKLARYRSPEEDCYGWAYLCGVITNYFKSGISVGVDRYDRLDTDNGDNGVYVIKNWEIVDRLYMTGAEQKETSLIDMLHGINNSMPETMRLSEGVIKGGTK